jgi:putative acetyltransferase
MRHSDPHRVLVRPERETDAVAIRQVHEEAFGRSAEADLVDALRAGDTWLPELSLVAEVDGEVVGHVLFSRVEVSDGTALALAPLAVRPAFQRRGLGGTLVRTGLDAAEALAENLVIVVGDPEYYGRFGFVPASRFGIDCPLDIPDAVFQALTMPGYGGFPKGTVRYPAAFGSV